MSWLMNRITRSSKSPAIADPEGYAYTLLARLEKELREYKEGINESAVKENLGRLNATMKFHETLTDSVEKLQASAVANKASQRRTLASIHSDLTRAMTVLSKASTTPHGLAVQAFETGAVQGNVTNGLSQFAGSYFSAKPAVVYTDPGLGATIREVKRLIARQQLGAGAGEEAYRKFEDRKFVEYDAAGNIVGGIVHDLGMSDNVTIKQLADLERYGLDQDDQRGAALRALDAEMQEMRSLQTQVEAMPEDADSSGLLGAAASRLKAFQATHADEATGDTYSAVMERYKNAAGEDSAMKRLEETAKTLAAQIVGGAPDAQEAVAKIIMAPEFQRWARGNGYADLGQGTWEVLPDGKRGKFLGYTEGKDDAKAMLLAHWQTRHPNRWKRPVTDRLVEVTVWEPDPAVVAKVDPATGKAAYIETAAGRHWLTPAEAAAKKQAKADAAEVAVSADGRIFAHFGTRTMERAEDGSWADLAGSLPDGLTWENVVIGGTAAGAEPKLATPDEVMAADIATVTPVTADEAAAVTVGEDVPPQTVARTVRGLVAKPTVTPQGVTGKTGIEVVSEDVPGGYIALDETGGKRIEVKELGAASQAPRRRGLGEAVRGAQAQRATRRAERARGEEAAVAPPVAPAVAPGVEAAPPTSEAVVPPPAVVGTAPPPERLPPPPPPPAAAPKPEGVIPAPAEIEAEATSRRERKTAALRERLAASVGAWKAGILAPETEEAAAAAAGPPPGVVAKALGSTEMKPPAPRLGLPLDAPPSTPPAPPPKIGAGAPKAPPGRREAARPPGVFRGGPKPEGVLPPGAIEAKPPVSTVPTASADAAAEARKKAQLAASLRSLSPDELRELKRLGVAAAAAPAGVTGGGV